MQYLYSIVQPLNQLQIISCGENFLPEHTIIKLALYGTSILLILVCGTADGWLLSSWMITAATMVIPLFTLVFIGGSNGYLGAKPP